MTPRSPQMIKIEPGNDELIDQSENSESGKRKLTKEQEAMLQELPTMAKKNAKNVSLVLSSTLVWSTCSWISGLTIKESSDLRLKI